MLFSFGKPEKLKSKKLIEQLFSEGNTITVFPIRLVYLKTELPENVLFQAGFSVGKKKFPKAVKRNKVKRLLKEAYRLNKPIIFNNSTTSYALMFLYLGKKEPHFSALNQTMKTLLEQFLTKTKPKESK